jgi:ribosomal protein L36
VGVLCVTQRQGRLNVLCVTAKGADVHRGRWRQHRGWLLRGTQRQQGVSGVCATEQQQREGVPCVTQRQQGVLAGCVTQRQGRVNVLCETQRQQGVLVVCLSQRQRREGCETQ